MDQRPYSSTRRFRVAVVNYQSVNRNVVLKPAGKKQVVEWLDLTTNTTIGNDQMFTVSVPAHGHRALECRVR